MFTHIMLIVQKEALGFQEPDPSHILRTNVPERGSDDRYAESNHISYNGSNRYDDLSMRLL